MKNCMNLNIKCLYYTGFWPKSQQDSAILQDLVYILGRVQLARMVFGMCVQSYNIYLDWGHVGHMLEYTTFLVIDLKLFIDIYTLVYRHNDIASVIGYIREQQELHSESQDPGQRKIVSLVNKITHYSTLVMTALMGAGLMGVAVLLTLFGLQHREIPFRKWFPFDVTYTPVFEITLIVLSITQTFDMLVVTIFAILFIAINIQLIGQFALLNYKLANMHELVAADILRRRQLTERQSRRQHKDQVQTKPAEQHVVTDVVQTQENVFTPSKGANRRLKTIIVDTNLVTGKFLQSCVDHHNELVESSMVLGSLFQTSYMTQVFYNGLTCLAMFYITNFSLNLDAKVAVEAALIFAAMAEFAVFCILGTALLECSCSVSYAAYSSDWFGMSMSVKKSLQIIMARAMKGISFSAFNVFPVTVDSFVSVMKFSYSAYAVLDSVSPAHKETAL